MAVELEERSPKIIEHEKLVQGIKDSINALSDFLKTNNWWCVCKRDEPQSLDICPRCLHCRPNIKQFLSGYLDLHAEKNVPWLRH